MEGQLFDKRTWDMITAWIEYQYQGVVTNQEWFENSTFSEVLDRAADDGPRDMVENISSTKWIAKAHIPDPKWVSMQKEKNDR